MNITFSGKYAVNPQTFGINFEAIVDGHSVVCMISTEALHDADQRTATDPPARQFEANRAKFEAVARAKILSGAVNSISISSADVRA